MNPTCQTPQTRVMLKTTPRVTGSGEASVDQPTLQSLFDSEETPLLRYAFSLVGRRAVAEEIVQEVFLELHKRWDEVESPRSWLFRSVRNRSYNHVRDNKREILNHSDEEIDFPAEADELPDVSLEHVEAVGVLRQTLEELSESDRQLVTLSYFKEMKYREISGETGLSIGNVGFRLHQILKELAARLRTLGVDETS